MEVEFEILAILATAFLLTIAGFVLENYKTTITLKLVAAITWFALALGFTASASSFLAFSILFMGIGIVLVIATIQDALAMFAEKKETKDLWWRK